MTMKCDGLHCVWSPAAGPWAPYMAAFQFNQLRIPFYRTKGFPPKYSVAPDVRLDFLNPKSYFLITVHEKAAIPINCFGEQGKKQGQCTLHCIADSAPAR